MAANKDELYAELCDDMTVAAEEQGDIMAGEEKDGIVLSPIVIGLFRAWVIRQVKKLACDDRETIISAAAMWIDRFVSNEQLKSVLLNVMETVFASLCPS